MEKISHLRQLEAWQEAHKLVLMVYQATKVFPSEERLSPTPYFPLPTPLFLEETCSR
jgi:hypothetical protein